MKLTWTRILIYLDFAAPLIMLVVALFILNTKRIKPNRQSLVLLYFLFVQALLNGGADFLMDYRINNHWVYHFNCIISHLLFSIFFLSLPGNKVLIIKYGFILFSFFWILNIGLIQGSLVFNSYSYALSGLVMVIYSMNSLKLMLDNPRSRNLLIISDFSTIAGVLIYFGCSFFIFISYSYLSEVSSRNVGVLWRMHNVFLTFGCILFLKAILQNKWIQE
jgi:hypothetical protein